MARVRQRRRLVRFLVVVGAVVLLGAGIGVARVMAVGQVGSCPDGFIQTSTGGPGGGDDAINRNGDTQFCYSTNPSGTVWVDNNAQPLYPGR